MAEKATLASNIKPSDAHLPERKNLGAPSLMPETRGLRLLRNVRWMQNFHWLMLTGTRMLQTTT